ncbi:RrF2 family transcriptional regulator [Deferribacter abyssi]|uniref:RrF2 family transcriptional regulator n=1 Tax=Deferribacter abyssi TaxID=213806 RepID=UPI003C1976BD
MSEYITREVDYAIRILAYLAGKQEKTKIAEICKKLHLKRPFVVKIIHKLNKCGIIKTTTGKNGGILINKDISKLSLYDICLCLGFKTSINICVNKPEQCELNPICNITTFFAGLQNSIVTKLKSAKIEQFIFNDEDLDKINQT